ncbi:putative disease resistance protein RGA4 [Carex rostrata]
MTPLSIAAIGWLMGSLVSKAVTEVLEAWAKRVGLDKEFKTLKDQLLRLDALLTSAHSLHTNNSFLKEQVHNLQQLAYKAENLLDELDYYRLEDQIQQKGTQDKVKCSNKSSVASSSSGDLLAKRPLTSTGEGLYARAKSYLPVTLPETFEGLYNLSRRMEELAEELQKSEEKLRNALQTESLVNISRKTEATNLPQTSPFHTKTREVVGRNKECEELLLNLTNEESATVGKVLVLAIVGCGGVGKTTLAGLVYNDPEVKKCFDIRSWICVSTRFDIVRFTREMLEAACDNRYDGISNLGVLQEKLMDKLESKKFLLVLDDMWEDEDKSQWDNIIALLSNCMVKRAIILVTTRNKSVAKMVDARDNTTYLEGLDKDVFLSFFSTCIFNDPNFGGNWRLRNIGQQIANELKGNPLAAKTVSALLKKNPDERYWLKIRDSEEWKSQNGPNDIMPALRLSYEHMPFHLQRCFSYCAIFPKDHPFTREELVYLWMAQGFLDVRSKGNRMEDIGSAYFDDMFDRGLFQTKQLLYHDDDKVYYTFHDLIRDLVCVVSSKQCLCINGAESKEIPQTIRHLSIFKSTKMAESEEEIVTALECLERENFGTIFDWATSWNKLPSRISHSILDLLKKTKFLHALRLDLCGPVQLHNCNFQNFVSLRYLRLIMSVYDNCKALPREICRLYHLEVLEIEDGRLLDELPNNFSDLVSLRHFIVKGKLHSKILGVGKLTSLQELNYFHVQQDSGFEIEQLGSLKEIGGSLEIWGLENVKSQEEANKARLAEKGKLDALYLEWNHGEKENEIVLEGLKPSTNLKSISLHRYGGVTSPRWLDPSLIFLESLTLSWCLSLHENLNIPNLRSLKISMNDNLESLDLHSCVALTDLEIIGCNSLTSLTFGDQMVCLTNLKIFSCKTLSSIKGLKSWVNLETLYFSKCPGFIAAWDSASKEIERTERDFSLSLKEIKGDFLAPLTLLICKQLTSLQTFITFFQYGEVSPHPLTSIDWVDIEGCKKKNLQSFPFNLFRSLEELVIRFYNIKSLSTSSYTEITDEFKKLTSIKGVDILHSPLTIRLELRHPVDPAEMELLMRMSMMRKFRLEDESDDDEDN